jgi:hypothetical protein
MTLVGGGRATTVEVMAKNKNKNAKGLVKRMLLF